MTDDDCGCSCEPCRVEDRHSCRSEKCGYTKYLAMTKPSTMRPAADGLDLVRAKFRGIKDEKAKERIREFAAYVQETAHLEPELRKLKRDAKRREMFGG